MWGRLHCLPLCVVSVWRLTLNICSVRSVLLCCIIPSELSQYKLLILKKCTWYNGYFFFFWNNKLTLFAIKRKTEYANHLQLIWFAVLASGFVSIQSCIYVEYTVCWIMCTSQCNMILSLVCNDVNNHSNELIDIKYVRLCTGLRSVQSSCRGFSSLPDSFQHVASLIMSTVSRATGHTGFLPVGPSSTGRSEHAVLMRSLRWPQSRSFSLLLSDPTTFTHWPAEGWCTVSLSTLQTAWVSEITVDGSTGTLHALNCTLLPCTCDNKVTITII